MVVRLALRRSREEARARQRSDSFRRESIASAQMAHGSNTRCVVAALPETVMSVWRSNEAADAQPLCWRRASGAPWVSSDKNMARRAGGGSNTRGCGCQRGGVGFSGAPYGASVRAPQPCHGVRRWPVSGWIYHRFYVHRCPTGYGLQS